MTLVAAGSPARHDHRTEGLGGAGAEGGVNPAHGHRLQAPSRTFPDSCTPAREGNCLVVASESGDGAGGGGSWVPDQARFVKGTLRASAPAAPPLRFSLSARCARSDPWPTVPGPALGQV